MTKKTIEEKEKQLSQDIIKNDNRIIQAGEKEIVLASEEVQTRNITSMMIFGNVTRKMVQELGVIVSSLQGVIMTQNKELKELRRQLSILQGEFYKKGTTSYSG